MLSQFSYPWVATMLTVNAGCSPDCAPTDAGGVLVEISGMSDCTRLSATAALGSDQSPLDAWPTSENDAGPLCVFRGLAGRTGTFSVSVYLDGQVEASQSVTLGRLDECNVSSKLLTFEVSVS